MTIIDTDDLSAGEQLMYLNPAISDPIQNAAVIAAASLAR
jgi:hypothetical protein